MKKHKQHKQEHHKYFDRTRKRHAAARMKTLKRSTSNRPKKKPRNTPRRPPPPRAVHRAIRRLLDTTNYIQARAAELENALEALRDQERAQTLKELLLALRNSPDGDILRLAPGRSGAAEAIIGALVEAFSISRTRNPGDRIPVQHGQIPDTFELDRSSGHGPDECTELEVVSAGWSYRNYPLLKPVVRPIFAAKPPSCAAEAKGNGLTLETSSSVTLSPPR